MSAHAMAAAPIMTLAELERAYDGRIPAGLLELAKRAPEKVAAIARTQLRSRFKAKFLRDSMAEAIVEIFEANGGEVSERDLFELGFNPDDIRAHRNAAMQAARPRLRQDRRAG